MLLSKLTALVLKKKKRNSFCQKKSNFERSIFSHKNKKIFVRKKEKKFIERYHEVILLLGTLNVRVVGLEQPSMHEYLRLIECF